MKWLTQFVQWLKFLHIHFIRCFLHNSMLAIKVYSSNQNNKQKKTCWASLLLQSKFRQLNIYDYWNCTKVYFVIIFKWNFLLTKQYKWAVVSSNVSFSPSWSGSSVEWLHKIHKLSDIFFSLLRQNCSNFHWNYIIFWWNINTDELIFLLVQSMICLI